MSFAGVATALAGLLCLLGLAFALGKLLRFIRKCRRKQARLDAINKEYENLRSVRKDAIYHHGWANSRGDYKEALSHEAHVEAIDGKLECLKRQYKAVEDGEIEDDISGVFVHETYKDR
eukprot:TRINITY_DN91116_c0_g1_i1.p1 TRINITY_DN91116_c0_g1~~TRINITY_DN91116_c0_g1_i1.p1  ORF type:complete len:119 (-),score=18.85 TRINITY_DN91116_c0_g1_i1:47-403(-)